MRNEVNNWQYVSFFMLIRKTKQYIGFFTRTYKTKYKLGVPFARLQKSQHKYIVSKSLSGLETFPNNS